MTKVVIIGAGNIGHALAALLGARPELRVVVWGRRWTAEAELAITAFGPEGTYAVGAVTAETSLERAAEGADVALIAVPTHVRRRVMQQIAPQLNECALLVAWEGTGWFRENLNELGIVRPVVVGLQRSPILCRVRRSGQLVELFGVRTEVVAASTDPGRRIAARRLLSNLLPFRFVLAPDYDCVAISPSNPLIHPARVYSCERLGRNPLGGGMRFYADWDDEASKVLLALHADVARLRDVMHLPKKYLRTLADVANPSSPSELTILHRAQTCLAELMVPLCRRNQRVMVDREHRFCREDIGEGLGYILEVAGRAGVAMPTARAIFDWYRSAEVPEPHRSKVHDAADHGLR